MSLLLIDNTHSFHCLFCHGYEERASATSGVLAVGDLANPGPALHFARNAHQITPSKVTLYTHGDSDLESSLKLSLNGNDELGHPSFNIDNRRIAHLSKGSHGAEVMLHFTDGSSVTEGFLAHKPKCQLKGDFAQQLGLELTPQGDLQASPPFFQTTMRGVFAAGDVASPVKIANNALFTGAAAGAGVAAQVQADILGHKSMI